MNNMHVHGSEVVENIAFQAQVWATVLVASSSGFSRTAAVLSRNVVIAPVLLSHPLEELPNVISLYDKSFWSHKSNFGVDESWNNETGRKLYPLIQKLKNDLHRNLLNQFETGPNQPRMKCLRRPVKSEDNIKSIY